MLLEAVLYALSGFFMKFSDDSMDLEDDHMLGIICGIICVVGIGYLSVTFSDAATIFLAILLGTLLSAKIDKLGHILSLILFMVILFIWGVPSIGVITLVLCTVAAWADELGNDRKSFQRIKILEIFFKYRCALKVTVLIMCLLGGLNLSWKISGLEFFQPITFIYFMLFDLAYELAGLKFDRIYNGLHGIYRVIR